MKKKLLGILVCTLLMATTVLPVTGIMNINKTSNDKNIEVEDEKRSLGWPSITEVVSTESIHDSITPSIAVDNSGMVHVAWHDLTDYGGSGTDQDIFYKYKPSGGSWSITEVVSTESTLSSYSASLAIDESGTVHVAWADKTNYGGSGIDQDIFYKYKPSGGSWSTTEVVSTESTSDSVWQSLAVYSTGRVYVTWQDLTDYAGSGSDSDIFYKFRISGYGWSITEVVSSESTGDSNTPAIAVDSNEIVHIVWEDRTGGGKIFYKYKHSGASWPTVADIVSTESTTYNVEWPDIAVDASGIVHVAWSDNTDYAGAGSDFDIFYKSKSSGGSWPTVTEVVSTESTVNSFAVTLIIDTFGTVHVAWFDKDPSPEILYKCKTSGGNWPAFTELISSESSEWCSQPRLAVDSLGSVHIAWNDETDYAGSGIDSDIFYKKKGAFYNAFGPGIIIAIGQGSVNSGTGLYNFSYGQLRFIGIGFLGGGPSFYHSTPTFSWTTGQYTTSSFFGLSMPIGSLVIIIGFLSSNGAISGNSYL